MKIYVNSEDNGLTWNKSQYLLAADKRLGLNIFEPHRDNGQEEEYVLNIQPFTFRKGTKWTGIWHIDVVLDSDIPVKYYNEADTVFVASSQGLIQHPRQQILFQAADLQLHKSNPKIEKQYDFVMCGSMDNHTYMPRDGIYNVLKNKFSAHNFGKGFAYNKYIDNYNQGRVQWVHPAINEQHKGMIAQRFFESMAIGPVLAYWSNDLSLLGFIDGKDYISYRSSEEALVGMGKLINNPELANAMAKRAREKIALYHTYEHRAMSIINTIKEL